jgi:hypothetical protein
MIFRKPKNPSAEELMAQFLTQNAPASDKNTHSELDLKFKALWLLLKDKLQLSEQDLEGYISKIKIEQEEAQTKAAEGIQNAEKCEKCGRTVSIKTGACLYCGV